MYMGFFESVRRQNRGQALVLILIVIVIAVVVIFAVSARTVQDLRLASQEKVSSKAEAQIESFLDVITSPTVWDSLLEPGGLCEYQGLPCTIGNSRLQELLAQSGEEWQCTQGAEVVIRGDTGVNGFAVGKDDAFEIDLREEVDNPFDITWTGDADYLVVKVFSETDLLASYALYHGGENPQGWATATSGSNITYAGNAVLARVRPLYGDASLTITGLETPQTATIKASCYIADVYREFVRTTQLNPTLPACFDYVLFDGSTAVDKPGEL